MLFILGMPYQFFQVVGLEKPADLRRARQALVASQDPHVACWADPLDQVVWMERPDREFTAEETAETIRFLHRAGFTVIPLDQSQFPGPACILHHRKRRQREISSRLMLTLAFGLPVLLLHVAGHRLFGAGGPQMLLALGWLQLLLTTAALATAGRAWLRFGLWSLVNRRWRWRTGVAVVFAGTWLLALIDLFARSIGRPGLLPDRMPSQTLCGPLLAVMAIVLLRALLIRWRLTQISRPFDRWLAHMSPADETRLRFFLRTQARHQRAGLDMTLGRLGNRFTDVGLIVAGGAFVAILVLTGQVLPAWLAAAGLLLVLDPRLFHFTWVAPEVLAGRQAVGLDIFFANPRVFQHAARLHVAVFDKTGTVTRAPAELAHTEINTLAALDLAADDLLQLAASVEQDWGNVVARSLLDAANRFDLPLLPVSDVRPSPGLGVSGLVDGRRIRVGSEFYLRAEGIDLAPFAMQLDALKRQPFSIVLVGVDSQLAGAIALADNIRPGSAQAVSELSRWLSVRMLTGDSASAAALLAAHLAIREVFVELEPAAKVALLNRWRDRGQGVALITPLGRNPELSESADVCVALAGGVADVDRHETGHSQAESVGSFGPSGRRLPGQPDIIILDEQVEQVPSALRLASRVRPQRRLGYVWTATLVLASTAAAVLWPALPYVGEWAPAVVSTLTLAGLPVILGRAAFRVTRNGKSRINELG